MKYLTVINTFTNESVPFFRIPLQNGGYEIFINSDKAIDTEDLCIVHLGDVFHIHSIDFRETYKKI